MLIIHALALAVSAPDPAAPTLSVVDVVLPPSLNAPNKGQALLIWQLPEVRCSGEPVHFTQFERPQTQFFGGWQNLGSQAITYHFRIDTTGRAVGIKRDSGEGQYPGQDIGPALAVSRFSSGRPLSDCVISYSLKRVAVDEASQSDLIEYTIFPDGVVPKTIFEQLKPKDSTCFAAPPAPLLRAFPDFSAISASPGKNDWSMVQFDIDASGKPVRVDMYATSGSKQLDIAAIEAVAKSRFIKGEKKGCLYPYWQRGKALSAPEAPDKNSLKAKDSTCPTELSWESKPIMHYPENFRRRSIEGWAIVAFDVAPWGGTGNVRVLAAEPAADFGDSAAMLISAAKVADAGQGYQNCVEKIRYSMKENAPIVPSPY